MQGPRDANDRTQGSQPWTVQFEARAKWDAWNEVKGMDAEEAKRQYVALLDKASQLMTGHPPKPLKLPELYQR